MQDQPNRLLVLVDEVDRLSCAAIQVRREVVEHLVGFIFAESRRGVLYLSCYDLCPEDHKDGYEYPLGDPPPRLLLGQVHVLQRERQEEVSNVQDWSVEPVLFVRDQAQRQKIHEHVQEEDWLASVAKPKLLTG